MINVATNAASTINEMLAEKQAAGAPRVRAGAARDFRTAS